MGSDADPRSDGDDLRQRLLDAAVELLREPDTPLDLRKVAERADKSRTAPYLVFGKEREGGGVTALRIAVAAEGARIMSDMMVEAAEGAADPIEGFHAVAGALLAFAEQNPRLFRLMYGPEIHAIARLGERGFRDHPEFRRLLRHRDRAGRVVAQLIRRAQERRLLPSDPVEAEPSAWADASRDLPSARFLQTAWATMIGMTVLRADDLLRAIGGDIDLERGARLVAQSVLGLDPSAVESAARTFLASPGVDTTLAEPHGGETPRPAAPGLSLHLPGPQETIESPPRLRMSAPGAAGRKFADVFRALRKSAPGKSARAEAEQRSVEDHDLPAEAFLGVESASVWDDDEETISLTNVLDSYSGLRRAAYAKDRLEGAAILWIDDHPDSIEQGARTLEHLGAHVTRVASTDDALRWIRGRASSIPLRAIVSDIARAGREDEGVRALPLLSAAAPGVPVIFFIADFDPERGCPSGAAGITNRTDDLLHMVVDALEGRGSGRRR